ncbi:MAG: GtrA family protein [Candidatus Zeuxoniibacter abyssi]|nr:MAG: GtrA family protein [Candidatus Persebacteraceae bacterium AB1(2)]
MLCRPGAYAASGLFHQPMKKNIGHQMRRFLLVGGVNTAVSYGLYVFFIWIGCHYALAAFFSNCISVVFNYFTIGWGVFGNLSGGRFYRFILGCAANYCVSVFFIWFFVLIGFNEYLSGFFAVAPVAVFSFCFNKYVVFHPSKDA